MPKDQAILQFWRRCVAALGPMNKSEIARRAGIHPSTMRQFIKKGILGPEARDALARVLFGVNSWTDVVSMETQGRHDHEEEEKQMQKLREEILVRMGMMEGRILGRLEFMQQQINELARWKEEIQRQFPFGQRASGRKP